MILIFAVSILWFRFIAMCDSELCSAGLVAWMCVERIF